MACSSSQTRVACNGRAGLRVIRVRSDMRPETLLGCVSHIEGRVAMRHGSMAYGRLVWSAPCPPEAGL
eukprot:350242-Chlamydomonas_euryale.AAC.10